MSTQQSLLFYGGGSHVAEILKACSALGFAPVGIHDPSRPTLEDVVVEDRRLVPLPRRAKRVRSLSEGEFRELARETGAPIVLVDVALSDRDHFREGILRLRNAFGLRNRVLHPSFLCDYYRSTHTRYLITGFPGSGNMAFQNALDRIVRSRSFAPDTRGPDALHDTMVRNALWYWQSLSGTVLGWLDDAGRTSELSGPTHVRYGNFFVHLGSGAPVVLSGLPQRSYVWANPWTSTHEPLTTEMLDFFDQQSFRVIHILRHPLDVLVSNAAKISVEAGRRAPLALISDPSWLRPALSRLVQYLRLALAQQHRAVVTVRYEDLLAHPARCIADLSGALGSRLPTAECESIWKEIDGRTLSGDVGHFWDPRAGKWREHIPSRCREAIEQSGIVELAERLGYIIDLEALDDLRDAGAELDPYLLAVADARWQPPIGKPPAYRHADLRNERLESGVRLIAPASCFDRCSAGLGGPLLRDMLDASSLEPWREPSEVSGYFSE